MNSSPDLDRYLAPATFLDSDHPAIIEFADSHCGRDADPRAQAVSLYYAVRDGFKYDPYQIDLRPAAMKASDLLTRSHGYCIEKAALFAAAARVVGIPSRLGFANVRNHIGTEKLQTILKSDVLVFHGYAEVYLDDSWIKATPAFNRSLCDLLGVAPLEFDGLGDSVFQQFTVEGDLFMEYLHDYGQFADIPRELFVAELRRYYPHVFELQGAANGAQYFKFDMEK